MNKSRTLGYIYELCRKLRQNPTEAENLLWDHLRTNRLKGLKFRRQHPIGRYIADFYCREARLVIELEGSVHNHKDQKEYDRVRQEIIEVRGLQVLRIKNIEVERNIERVLQKILSLTSPPLSPSPFYGEGDSGGEVKRRNNENRTYVTNQCQFNNRRFGFRHFLL